MLGCAQVFLTNLGLRGAALARAIVRRDAEEGGEGRGGEGQVEVGEEVRFGEMVGGRWRPRRALAARA